MLRSSAWPDVSCGLANTSRRQASAETSVGTAIDSPRSCCDSLVFPLPVPCGSIRDSSWAQLSRRATSTRTSRNHLKRSTKLSMPRRANGLLVTSIASTLAGLPVKHLISTIPCHPLAGLPVRGLISTIPCHPKCRRLLRKYWGRAAPVCLNRSKKH